MHKGGRYIIAFLVIAGILTYFIWTKNELDPELLIINAQIWQDRNDDSIWIRNSRIVKLGRSVDLMSECGPNCAIVDIKGQFVIPGFHDGHIHMVDMAEYSEMLDVRGQNRSQIQQSLKKYIGERKNSKYVVGSGWSAEDARKYKFHARDLDAIASDYPLVLRDQSGHHAWGNSKALEVANIARSTADPKGGFIERDSDGNPTGLLFENAVFLLNALFPSKSVEEFEELVLRAQDMTIKYGITSVQSARFRLSNALMEAYINLLKRDAIRQRTFIWGHLDLDDSAFENQLRFAEGIAGNEMLRVSAFKGFVDGEFEANTAALIEPYEGTKNYGTLNYTQEQLDRLVLTANKAGFPVALHANGDRAVRVALNSIEYSQNVLSRSFGNRIEHVGLVSKDDVSRFRKLSVVASVQPNLILQKEHLRNLRKWLGKVRFNNLYNIESLREDRALIVFGSDFPYGKGSDPDPRNNMRMALNSDRRSTDSRISMDDELRFYTENSAVAAGVGAWLGRIAPGYVADLVVFESDPSLIGQGSKISLPSKVIINGRIVF